MRFLGAKAGFGRKEGRLSVRRHLEHMGGSVGNMPQDEVPCCVPRMFFVH